MAVGRKDGSEGRSPWIGWSKKRLISRVASFGIFYRKLRDDSDLPGVYVRDTNGRIPCLQLWKSGRYHRNRHQEFLKIFRSIDQSSFYLVKNPAISTEAITDRRRALLVARIRGAIQQKVFRACPADEKRRPEPSPQVKIAANCLRAGSRAGGC